MKYGIALVIVVLLVFGISSCFTLQADPNELALGVKAPTASLQDSDGKPTSIKSLYKKGFPVLVFYRGKW